MSFGIIKQILDRVKRQRRWHRVYTYDCITK